VKKFDPRRLAEMFHFVAVHIESIHGGRTNLPCSWRAVLATRSANPSQIAENSHHAGISLSSIAAEFSAETPPALLIASFKAVRLYSSCPVIQQQIRSYCE
jgi:hypothetical protein